MRYFIGLLIFVAFAVNACKQQDIRVQVAGITTQKQTSLIKYLSDDDQLVVVFSEITGGSSLKSAIEMPVFIPAKSHSDINVSINGKVTSAHRGRFYEIVDGTINDFPLVGSKQEFEAFLRAGVIPTYKNYKSFLSK